MTKKALAILIIAIAILLQPCISAARSDYEFYFFGVNSKAFKESNWLMVTTGAIASILAHEIGHALYLESQGKDWDLLSSSSGLAIHTDNYLTNKQYRNFGQSGFALQTGIGVLLTSFESTKHLDFTKGWVSMNVAQLYTYGQRKYDNGDDFALIERGNGDKGLISGVSAFITQNNLLVAFNSPNPMLYNVPDIAKRKEAPSAWHFDTAFGQEQTAQRALKPSKDELSMQQVKGYQINYAKLHRY